jgi:hypothetical protein
LSWRVVSSASEPEPTEHPVVRPEVPPQVALHCVEHFLVVVDGQDDRFAIGSPPSSGSIRNRLPKWSRLMIFRPARR